MEISTDDDIQTPAKRAKQSDNIVKHAFNQKVLE
jgi:hypothetical protein